MSDYMADKRAGLKVQHEPRQCEMCPTIFIPKDKRKRFCSGNCKQKARYRQLNPRAVRTCAHPDCDADLTDRRSDVKWCSDRCREKIRVTPELRRKYRLANKYNLTPADYDAMAESQGHVCAICKRDDPGTSHGFWHIDHCHETGRIRGLLCSTCNTGLGNFYDNPAWLQSAKDYVLAG